MLASDGALAMSVGRNDPCVCGSGKKYKHCCLDKTPCQGDGGRCGKPTKGALTCKLCGKLYPACAAHQPEIRMNMNGHVLRSHPETLPTEQFDRLLRDETGMATFRQKAREAPDLWRVFFEYVDERQSGQTRTPAQRAEAAQRGRREQAARLRDQATHEPGELIRWYDGAWEFLLSSSGPGEIQKWAFSAMLFPRGRGSTEQDWRRLHHWTEALGIPQGSEVGKTIEATPNAVHKWVWVQVAKTATPPAN
jgi:hypothetical protein